jgi:predicted DNA-binding transcriptional regulator YafY
MRRAFTTLALLQAGDASREELIEKTMKLLGYDIYGEAPIYSFRRDLAFLREIGCEIVYHRSEGVYHLEEVHNPYLTLPLTADDLEALSLIRGTFQPGVPHADNVRALLDKIERYLSKDDRRALRREPLLSLSLAPAGDLTRHWMTLEILERAISKRQRLEFEYRSPKHCEVKRHFIEPYGPLEFRDGHIYFEGLNVNTDHVYQYRLDRIVPGSAEILPRRFPEGRRRKRRYILRYRLAPEIARYGASERFPGQREEVDEEGWTVVTAEIDDLFWASKKLLKYGENCQVLEPPELVEEMKRVVREMAKIYEIRLIN